MKKGGPVRPPFMWLPGIRQPEQFLLLNLYIDIFISGFRLTSLSFPGIELEICIIQAVLVYDIHQGILQFLSGLQRNDMEPAWKPFIRSIPSVLDILSK